jgi:hypothetical protein
MGYNAKNYNTNGGNTTVIGGELDIASDAVVKVGGDLVEFTGKIIDAYTKAETDTLLTAKLTATKSATQVVSTAADVAGLVTDFNALLAKLKSAGIML